MYPKYLKAYQDGVLEERADRLYRKLKNCEICPRNCKVNRLEDKIGFCKTGKKARVCSYFSHHGEEPAISGSNGSGTIFFAHCNLRCVYCQNYEFSQLGKGREADEDELASYMLELQKEGCHNINFVSPTHVLPQILKALILAVPSGLSIPLVYNTSGYDSEETLKMLEGIFDIYLPDARYADSKIALKLSQAQDYPAINQRALKEMHRQAGTARFDKEGIIESGVIIRHLVLPNNLSGTDTIMRFIACELSKDTWISLMSQYFPCYKARDYPEISRRITREEYQKAMDIMHSYGLRNGWVQDEGGLDRFAGVNIKTNV
ncbi:MAG: radical SAM protein [Omnitrophica WOR_2 bacterium RIFCSPLOWO2_12_FULL_46_30]|nr:MAG: radical SAM protein [Omnitrophica WOR_2 bacterium RIFCSPHIGHO2_02_FULL_46_37]OGX51278.1 MAG: radical SAM protein [Omnitrophica WOR_2 bacterium RIFCSPLOWO2_12_FULL_46_30]